MRFHINWWEGREKRERDIDVLLSEAGGDIFELLRLPEQIICVSGSEFGVCASCAHFSFCGFPLQANQTRVLTF